MNYTDKKLKEFDKICPVIDWRGYPSRNIVRNLFKQTIKQTQDRQEIKILEVIEDSLKELKKKIKKIKEDK